MRLTELRIDNYGGYAARSLAIPEGAGLSVIYGPNEAGKSTCLEAISDFLFSIPPNTARGSLFGYDGMRISASMRMADDRLISLKRRKGRGRTLSDADGTALDDAALAPVLGAITRDRFGTLFGLNHDTLRAGGERLLQADGDIGRLIVEAGGGLRTLLARLDAIDDEAGRLFDGRRSSARAFYQHLDAFDAADRAVREGQFTRETYEQSRKQVDVASAKLNGLRDERLTLAARIARTDRTIRVAPRLRELDEQMSSLDAFADVADLPPDFAVRVRAAANALTVAEGGLQSATDRRDRLQARIDGLAVSSELSAAETRIRDAAELSIHVSKARGDRPNRQIEIDQGEAQLVALRRMLDIPTNADLAGILPAREAIDNVRALLTAANERRPAHSAARTRAVEITDKIETTQARLTELEGGGFHTPLETTSSQFSGAAAQQAGVDARRRSLDGDLRRIVEGTTALGFATMGALEALACPTPDLVRAEQAARDALENQRAEQERLKRQAERDLATGQTDIEALEASGTVASDEAVREARASRTLHWSPIRAAFVAGTAPGTEPDRIRSAEAYEATLAGADGLADRRADEAERAASLVQARRRIREATRTQHAAEEELAILSLALEKRVATFRDAFPDADACHPTLAALLAFAERRTQLMEQTATARSQDAALARDAALLEPTVELAGAAERRLGIEPAPAFASRMQALVAAHGRHELLHAEHQRHIGELKALRSQAANIQTALDRMDAEEAAFETQWAPALRLLGAAGPVSLAQADELLSEWASARGVLSAIAQTRQRVRRMDEDEARLAANVAALLSELGIEAGVDCVAGAQLLKARWDANAALRTQRDGLLPDVEEAKLAVEQAAAAVERAVADRTALAHLAAYPDTGEELSGKATRHDERNALVVEMARVGRSLADLGGGVSVEALRAEWGDADLDDLRATLTEDRSRAAALETEVEEAVLAEKKARDTLAGFVAESGVAGAVVRREGAATQMHQALERYLELKVARDLVTAAMATIRAEQQDPLIRRASALFAGSTRGEFLGVETDIDDRGNPVVVGRRAGGGTASVGTMSDGTRDQLFLAFRLASLENYGGATEPLPFIADDVLVHFDDDRSAATLELLAEFGRRNQVLLFTHHRSVRDLAAPLAARGLANIVSFEAAGTAVAEG
ncbi:AAA family ATPase [Sphingomonas sp. A2-49]|uniref:YhaN family protein n=1 Tax=Sphingomonas sp. A2-49 TaxID=1391375 RepID=UPI0021D3016E|nr:YhaN family protein [Sphingomonas sp. A2-49]MCU6456024.1 AAA family ATPase [Sphingomonas sp. A2-49]